FGIEGVARRVLAMRHDMRGDALLLRPGQAVGLFAVGHDGRHVGAQAGLARGIHNGLHVRTPARNEHNEPAGGWVWSSQDTNSLNRSGQNCKLSPVKTSPDLYRRLPRRYSQRPSAVTIGN